MNNMTPTKTSQVFILILFVAITQAQTFSDYSHLIQPSNNPNLTWGTSAADFNNDGMVDIFVNERLYLNKGELGFVDIIESLSGFNMNTYGAIFGDYNNDGYLDIFMEDPSSSPGFFLYRNNHNRTFTSTDITANLAVNFPAQGAGWADFNLDGKLDLFIGNDRGLNQLFKNLDYYTFEDISETAGVEDDDHTYGVSWGDLNNDRYPDIFVAPCHPNIGALSVKNLYLNNGDETFTNINVTAGVNDSLPSWGIVWLDYNNDNYLDVFIANMFKSDSRPGYNKLYRNNRNNTFSDISDSAGVGGEASENSWGCAAADFDNDGWIDIYVANDNQNHRIYKNNGDGTFTDVAGIAGISEHLHRVVAVADYNNDGFIDIFTAGRFANRLMLNNGGANHWLSIKARGIASNLFGIGTRVELYSNGLRQIREINAGDSFCSQNDNLTAHFGLGTNTNIDSIVLRWPSGITDIIYRVSNNQQITIVEGVGINNAPSTLQLSYPIDASTLASFENQFTWQKSADIEENGLSYSLYIFGEGVDTIITNIPDTTVIINLDFLEPGNTYNWTVDATDGYSITSSTDVLGFTMDIQLGVIETSTNHLNNYSIDQNYPNPFNPSTEIKFNLPIQSHVLIEVYNILGKKVLSLIDQKLPAGNHQIIFNGDELSSGIYYYRFNAADFLSTKKMILLK